MLNEQTLQTLNALKLFGMARSRNRSLLNPFGASGLSLGLFRSPDGPMIRSSIAALRVENFRVIFGNTLTS
jgi:hypothetical protein